MIKERGRGGNTEAEITGAALVVYNQPIIVRNKVVRTTLFLEFLSEEAAEPVPSRLGYRQLTMFFDKRAVWKAFCGYVIFSMNEHCFSYI